MAFKIGNRTVLHDADPSAALLTNSNLDSLQINGTDVLTHDGSTVTLKNVALDSTAGSNLTASINTNTANIATNTADIAANTTAITTNTTAIATNATAITTGDASTLTSANAYTDTREVAITTAYTAAIASSTSSGTASANAYTDSEIATATTDITTAYTSADQLILASAKGYTDTREVAITTAYQTYADQAEADAKAYADTEIANLVDSAPTTLDTLNELASALGDDANFSTTVTNSIATKLATADFTSTADTWLGTKDTGDLAEGSNLYYTDARVDARITNAGRTPITGSDLDMNGNRVLFANVYATTGDLPSATTYHGMFAHVHATGKGYFAHAGNWVELANASEVFDGNYNSLTNLPTIPTNNNQLANGAGYVTTDTNTTYTAGNGLSLSGSNEFTMSGSYTGSFTATGDVTAYSDKRLKRNIETITNAVDTVSKLRGVNYEKDGRNSTGVIAQEIEEVLPQVVHTDADGMKSVAYGNIVGILIEAIKEQQKEIEELKKKL